MVSVDKLIILFQNQYVDYIKKIQSNLTDEQYNTMKEYYSSFKQGDYDNKMKMLVDFINNLMEYSNVIISKDNSIFADDDLIYGDRDVICLIPAIDFRPLVKINEQLMWDTIQKMYVLANRIINEDEKYMNMITKNIFDSFMESLSNPNIEYKSTTFIKNIVNKFTEKLNKDKELYEFKNKCTTDISVDKIAKFVKNNKSSLIKIIKNVIYIGNETFSEEADNINVFDLRDDFVTLLDTADTYLSDKNNKLLVTGILNMAKTIPFFVNLQDEYKQKLDINGSHIIINKLKEAAKKFNNTQDIVIKVKELLSSAVDKIETESFENEINKYIDSTVSQVINLLPMLNKITNNFKLKTNK